VSDRRVLTTLFSELIPNQPNPAVALCTENLLDWVPELQAFPSVIASALKPAEKKQVLSTIPIAVTPGSYAIAELGSIAILYDEVPETLPIFLADSVVVVIKRERIMANLYQLFSQVTHPNLSNMILMTGPSRTADIEKVLVLGAHGPHRLIVCCID
jgi:L-lactate dehydrogenase complex protein LldG